MKRFLAFVGLLFVCVGPVTADYLFIKIDLNKVNFSGDGGGQPGGQPGFQPGGAQPGFQPGGAQPGFQPGGGQPGIAAPPQAAFGGKGGKGGKGGGLQAPAVAPPMVQGGGNAPLGGVPSAVGGFGPGGPNAQNEPETPPHYILAYLELKTDAKTLQQSVQGSPTIYEADHNLGKKGRFPEVPIVEYKLVKKKSVAKEYSATYGKYLSDGKDAAGLYRAASWALAHGLTKQFHDAMALLAKAEPNHFAVTNYQRVQVELKKAPAGDDPALSPIINLLKDEEFRLSLSDAGHYGLLAKAATPQAAAMMKRRLNRFEAAFENFYYWFALQEGVQQPALPKYRLYALLVEDKTLFHSKHAWWGSQPMVTDGFTPRRDNLIVLSAKRLDENYIVFEKNVGQLVATAKMSRDELITGDVWNRPEAKANVFGVSAVQTLALMQKAMEEESERAAISHEATRQLLFASGMLPRLVNVPEWVQSGLASYFDTPAGALYNGVGLPSWSNLIAFNYYRRANKLGSPANAKDAAQTAYEVLVRTITNKYFRDAMKTEQEQREFPEKEFKQSRLKEENEVAQSTAWALTYYLVNLEKKMPQMMRYTQELSNLPRDLELDDRTLQACFARAFDLTDPKDQRRLDPVKARTFAVNWFNRMLEVNLEVQDAERIYLDYRYPPPPKKVAGSGQPGAPFGVAPGPNPNIGPGANPNIGPGANPLLPGGGK